MGVSDIHPKDKSDQVISEFEATARGEKTLAPNIPCLSFHAARLDEATDCSQILLTTD
jgi:hypothetical protein